MLSLMKRDLPRPRDMVQKSSSKILTQAEYIGGGTDSVPGLTEPRRSNRPRKAKPFGYDFQLYLVEGTRDETVSQYQ